MLGRHPIATVLSGEVLKEDNRRTYARKTSDRNSIVWGSSIGDGENQEEIAVE